MILIQILTLIFILFVVSRTLLRAKDKKISIGELFFWLAIWFGLSFVVFFPGITSQVADLLGIGRGADVITYVSIGILFYLIFRLYVKLEDTERKITLLVRELAFEKNKKK